MRVSVVLALTQLVWLCSRRSPSGRAAGTPTSAGSATTCGSSGLFVALSAVNIAVFVAGRMRRWLPPSTIVVFIAVRGLAAWLSLHGDGVRTQDELTLLLVGSLVRRRASSSSGCWCGSGGRRVRSGTARAKAWYGGAAAVLIGASGWIALLFTTAAVTAAAEYLNGPDQSVSDLTSTRGRSRSSAAPEKVTEPKQPRGRALKGRRAPRRHRGDGGDEGATPQLVRGAVEVDTADVVVAGG